MSGPYGAFSRQLMLGASLDIEQHRGFLRRRGAAAGRARDE
ncbi:hypothetical protein [Nocardioides sp. AN3]